MTGSVASALVGGGLGWLGGLILPGPIGQYGLLFILCFTVTAVARELNLLVFPWPQLKRQTKDIWAKIFPNPVAAALWGFDLGLIFTTWLSFSGAWLLVVVTILVGKPLFGIGLFALYWLGRALSIWLAPLWMPDATATSQLMNSIRLQRNLFHRVHVAALLWAFVVFALWLS
jgi:hypothetical protein